MMDFRLAALALSSAIAGLAFWEFQNNSHTSSERMTAIDDRQDEHVIMETMDGAWHSKYSG